MTIKCKNCGHELPVFNINDAEGVYAVIMSGSKDKLATELQRLWTAGERQLVIFDLDGKAIMVAPVPATAEEMRTLIGGLK